MQPYRRYGNPPYQVALLHGGPGAPGEMAPVAQTLSQEFGVLEHLQTADTIESQLLDLAAVLQNHASLPVALAGHSWGAMLGVMFAARFPKLVSKLVMISSGVFEQKYAINMMSIRLARLSEVERKEVQRLNERLKSSPVEDKPAVFSRLGALMSKADAYDPLPETGSVLQFQPEIYQRVWPEAEQMRQKGELLQLAAQVRCPVIAIHGEHDTHLAEGIQALEATIPDFRFILLEKCGHTPWLERQAQNRFYDILKAELHLS